MRLIINIANRRGDTACDGADLLEWRLVACWCARECQYTTLEHSLGGRCDLLDAATTVKHHALVTMLCRKPMIDFRQDGVYGAVQGWIALVEPL